MVTKKDERDSLGFRPPLGTMPGDITVEEVIWRGAQCKCGHRRDVHKEGNGECCLIVFGDCSCDSFKAVSHDD